MTTINIKKPTRYVPDQADVDAFMRPMFETEKQWEAFKAQSEAMNNDPVMRAALEKTAKQIESQAIEKYIGSA